MRKYSGSFQNIFDIDKDNYPRGRLGYKILNINDAYKDTQ